MVLPSLGIFWSWGLIKHCWSGRAWQETAGASSRLTGEFPSDSSGFGRWPGHPQPLCAPFPCVVCVCTDGAGRSKAFFSVFLRNTKLRCDYRTVKKELPETNFQMARQSNYWRVNSKVELFIQIQFVLLIVSSWWVLFCPPVHGRTKNFFHSSSFFFHSSFSFLCAGNILLNFIPQESKTYGLTLSPAVENSFVILLFRC